MICKRCGRNNPPNVRSCTYCGMPLMVQNKKNNQKQAESVIVALIIILLLLLAAVAGVYIYKNSNIRRTSYVGSGGGRGGDSLPPTFTQEPVVPSEPAEPSDPVTPPQEEPRESHEEDIPAPQEQEESRLNERLEKKNIFLEKADDIEWYSETYLETAETQSEINSESSIVYKKWDALLNEVYQYLKTIMPESEFEQLEEDEIAWIGKKEKAIEAAGAEWEGGSGEPMARNLTAIQYTEERCYYLISLIN